MNATTTINQHTFIQSLISGAKEVIRHKDSLNAINVFPVADGDTGNNLARLMERILASNELSAHTKATLREIGDAALEGARGNSGIIFAQYINGLVQSFDETQTSFSEDELIEAINNAVPYAYEAIETPVEGTMITLMREWAKSLKALRPQAEDFTDLLHRSLVELKQCLEATPDTLAVLKKHGVVDSGAQGFVHFIEGISLFFSGEDVQGGFDEQVAQKASHTNDDEDFTQENYRYCTEALLTGENLSPATIRAQVRDLGDSLVVAGNPQKVRVHIHTDHPAEVMVRLRDTGTIKEQKVDDMKRQYEIIYERKYDIALVTDSIADLPQEVIDTYQIHQVPLILTIEDSDYFDKRTITSQRLYEYMDTLDTYPSSSQPNLKAMQEYFTHLSNYYDHVLAVSVSSKMSGTYNVFKQAAKVSDNVHTIDSRQNSGAQGLLIMRAAEMLDAGENVDTITSALETLRTKAKILVSVRTMKYMVRSGRVSKTTGLIGKLANLKPVISIDEAGEGIIFAKALSLPQSTRKIKAHVKSIHDAKGIERYAIVHANAPQRAAEYANKFEQMLGKKPIYTMDISSIVAMNAGIGTVAVAYISK